MYEVEIRKQIYGAMIPYSSKMPPIQVYFGFVVVVDKTNIYLEYKKHWKPIELKMWK